MVRVVGARGETLAAAEGVELFPHERLAELGKFVLELEVSSGAPELVGAAELVVLEFLRRSNSRGEQSSSGASAAERKGAKGK